MTKMSLLLSVSAAPVLLSALALAQTQTPLPNGPAKQLVETACTVCHEIGRVTGSGHTPEEWNDVVHRMVMMGAELKPEQVTLVSSYLASALPPKAAVSATTIAGAVQANFKEWPLAMKGAFPHDPYVGPDGYVWYTGQQGNVIGRVDPKTGEFKDYPLKTRGSGPHGLVGDKAGNIWFTAQGGGYIGKLDPKTGEVTEHKLTDGARDPHTPIFDQQGVLWFTVQGSNMVGRLDPKTGAMKVVQVPTPRSSPYGIVVNSKGVPFFAEFGSNKIASIDPKTMEIKEYALPNQNTRPRRIAITSDDVIWYGDYSRGYLGMYDPKTGQSKEWKSPGAEDSQPYGITALNDVIYYSESGVTPNTLVRFDPKTEKFQTWVIPAGGGVVRNMMPTPDGKLALAESGRNTVALVELK